MPEQEFQVPSSRFQAAVPAWASELGIAHVAEYFHAWAILPQALESQLRFVQQMNLQLHVAEYREAAPRVSGGSRDYAVAPGRVAVIDLSGPLMKQASSFSGGTSTVRARRQIRDAAADDEIAAILLRIDSPGGTVAGAAELGDEIARAASKKPVDAYIDDLGASGAYWAASQTRRIYTNRTGIVGSIGTYGVLVDASGKAAQQGLKVHVVRAGEMKGAGYPGTEIDAAILQDEQQLIDQLNEHFIKAVATGRRLTQARARELADGRVYVGQAALDAGLIDGVQSFDETLSQLQTKSNSKTTSKRSAPRMSAETNSGDARIDSAAELHVAAGPAAYHELKAALPGADADFICRQMEANATVAQAQAAWLAELGRRNQALAQERDAVVKERDEIKAAAASRPGVDPLAAGRRSDAADGDGDEEMEDDEEGEATAKFNSLVAKEAERLGGRGAETKKGQLPVSARAVMNVASRHPQLHRAMVAEANGDFANGLPRVFSADPLGDADPRKRRRKRA